MSDTDPNAIVVDRGQFDIGQRATNLLNAMLGHPKHAAAAEAIIQELNPNAKFPGRAVREAAYAPVNAALEEERAARLKLEERLNAREKADQEAADKRAEADIEARIEGVKRQHGFSDEAMEKVIGRMREKNNPDIEAAAAYVAGTMPRATPAIGNDGLPRNVDNYGFGTGDEAWKGLHANPDRWLADEIRKTVADPEFLRLGNQ